MKVIDLLNKIANDEEVPRKIKFNDEILEFKFRSSTIEELYNNWNGYWLDICNVNLNDEVEIIEEPHEHKIPEKIDLSEWTEITSKEDLTYETLQRIFNKNCSCFVNKINEIIDYLEKQNDNNSN